MGLRPWVSSLRSSNAATDCSDASTAGSADTFNEILRCVHVSVCVCVVFCSLHVFMLFIMEVELAMLLFCCSQDINHCMMSKLRYDHIIYSALNL